MGKPRLQTVLCAIGVLCVAAGNIMCLADPLEVLFTVDPTRMGVAVPSRFLGLSFEPADVIRDPNILKNRPQIFTIGNCLHNYMKLLQPGHMRIGGLLGDSPRNSSANDPTHIGPLLDFARDIDWIIDWTLRFAPYEPEAAVPTIEYILRHGADLLRFVAVGTEPENYVGQLRRPEGWGKEEHVREFSEYVGVLRRTFPSLRLYGPNMVGNRERLRSSQGWIRFFATAQASQLDALAVHLYPLDWSLPTGDLRSSLCDLLSLETRMATAQVIDDVLDLGRALRLPVYVSETNAGPDTNPAAGYFRTFASALNMLDNLFLMARAGIQGAAIHVGGKTWWHMAPVQMGDWGKGQYPCMIRPLAYSMLLFSVSNPGHFVHSESNERDMNVHCHAFMNRDGQLSVVLINKDIDRGFNVAVDPGQAHRSASTLILEGAWRSEEARLGGATIASTGEWEPVWGRLEPTDGRLLVSLEAATAILLVFE